MNVIPTEEAQVLYEARLRFAEVIEYGIGFQDLLSGRAGLPPAGARFDVGFTGSLDGPRLKGAITGTDYLNIRADGRLQLHIHGRVATPDGANISFVADAVGMTHDSGVTHVRENVTLYSAFAEYAWVNRLAVWSMGAIDPAAGEIRVKAYAL